MQAVDWYFDFISPFSYLQHSRLAEISACAHIRYRPVLFASLLEHWGQIGPAELPSKRGWTYRHALWLAHHYRVPMTLPSAHPFNPLPLLRLSIALGNTPDVVERLFDYVWREGHIPAQREEWEELLAEMQVDPAELTMPEVKETLRANTDAAIAAGVFGVPTAVLADAADGDMDDENNPNLFWGFDSTDMLIARLNGDAFFNAEEYAQAGELPVGIQRRS